MVKRLRVEAEQTPVILLHCAQSDREEATTRGYIARRLPLYPLRRQEDIAAILFHFLVASHPSCCTKVATAHRYPLMDDGSVQASMDIFERYPASR